MKKLLIVDDEDAMRGLYRRRLSTRYEVFETGDPEQAVALAFEHRPDAILLDLHMPKFNGFELCQNFRSLSYTSTVPIFIITGQSGGHRKECEAMGAAGFFEKPIDFNNLARVLTATLKDQPTASAQRPELKMRVVVKLQGKDEAGVDFSEVAETESVSADGFTCKSAKHLSEGANFDVFLDGNREKRVGGARIIERSAAGLDRQRYRFKFESEAVSWVVKRG